MKVILTTMTTCTFPPPFLPIFLRICLCCRTKWTKRKMKACHNRVFARVYHIIACSFPPTLSADGGVRSENVCFSINNSNSRRNFFAHTLFGYRELKLMKYFIRRGINSIWSKGLDFYLYSRKFSHIQSAYMGFNTSFAYLLHAIIKFHV